MPVEIRELIIRAVAIPEQKATENIGEEQGAQPVQDSTNGKEAIIQECVRQVLRILRKEKER